MSKREIIVIVICILVIIGVYFFKNGPKKISQQDAKISISKTTYIKDHEKNICFAIISYQAPYLYGLGFTEISCEKVKKYISN